MTPITIDVSNSSLPVTIGVPMSKAANLFDVNALTVKAPTGVAVPAAFRVTSRWQGLVADQTKPIKWLLVDLMPVAGVVGRYTIDDSGVIASRPILDVINSIDTVRVQNSWLDVVVPRSGPYLLSQFKLNGAEQLSGSEKPQLVIPAPDRASSGLVALDGSAGDGVAAAAGQHQIRVQDASVFQAGQSVRFEWHSRITSYTLGGINFTAGDHYGAWYQHETSPPREIIIARDTLREFVIASFDLFFGSAIYGDMNPYLSQLSNIQAGDTIEDRFALLEPPKIIQSVDTATNIITFTEPLHYQQMAYARAVADSPGGALPTELVVDDTEIEEQNSLRVVVRQYGHFASAGSNPYPHLKGVIRYYFYAGHPFVRVRLRLKNASDQIDQPVDPAVFDGMGFSFPLDRLVPPFEDSVLVHSGMDSACQRLVAGQSHAVGQAGDFQLAVAEFAENFPSRLTGADNRLTYWPFPLTGQHHTFHADWAKTWDFYLGQDAHQAMALTSAAMASLDPAYVAGTKAVRHALVPKRAWGSADFGGNAELAEAANRAEQMLASIYDIEANAPQSELGPIQRMSLFEWRLSNHLYPGSTNDRGAHFGWDRFGNTREGDGDGYTFNRYDLPFLLLREWLRTSDARAFRLGNEHARYMADAGTVQSDIAYNGNVAYNLKGLNRYERSPNLTFGTQSPRPTHSWSEGLWLYWALTGDPIAKETALLHRDAALRWNYQGIGWNPAVTVDGSMAYNEARGVGWAALDLLAAYKYLGITGHLERVKQYLDNLRLSEESQGSLGVYVALGYELPSSTGTQPFVWAGYPAVALTEYLRERAFEGSRDAELEAFLVRVARWLLDWSATFPEYGQHRPVVGGDLITDGGDWQYLPFGSLFTWYPGMDTNGMIGSVGLMALSLTPFPYAAQISNQPHFKQIPNQIFRDIAFYRDAPDGWRDPAERRPISLRNPQFSESSLKLWAQCAHSMGEFLFTVAVSEPPPPPPPDNTVRFPFSFSTNNFLFDLSVTGEVTFKWKG